MRKIIYGLLLLPVFAFAQTVQFKSSNVKITGGTINGAAIGGTTPAAITGTALTATSESLTGNLTMNGLSAGATRYYITNEGSAGTGRLVFQAGIGSGGAGGAINLYAHSHATHPGDVVAGISANSGGSFRVNGGALDAGTDIFTVSSVGAITMPGLASSSAATTGTLCWTTGTGNVNVDTTLACLASTLKVKQAVKPLDIGLSEVMRMRPISYDLKPEFNPEHLGRQVGLIAEEVAKIDDRLVAVDDQGDPRGVRYMQMTAVLIKAIQEQQKDIVLLRGKIKKLSVK